MVAVIVLLSHPIVRGLISTYLTVPLGMIGLGASAKAKTGDVDVQFFVVNVS